MSVQDVHIQTLQGIFLTSIEEEASIFDLKKKIEKENGIPVSSSLTYLSYEVTDDEALVKDFLAIGSNTFTILPPKVGEDASNQEKEVKTTNNWTDDTVYLVTGNRHSFQWLLIPPKSTMSFEAKSNKFGVVYGKEGSEGNRVFHLEAFTVTEPGTIKLEGGDGAKPKVFLVQDQITEQIKELHGVMKTYYEKMNRQESCFDKVAKVVKMFTSLATIGLFATEVADLVLAENQEPTS